MEGGGWRAGGVARVSEEEVESGDDEGQEPSRFIHLPFAHFNQPKPAASAVEPPDQQELIESDPNPRHLYSVNK